MRANPNIKKLYDQCESTEHFWCNIMHFNPNIAKIALRKILPYATTVMVERGFSGMNDLKTSDPHTTSDYGTRDTRMSFRSQATF